MTRIVGIVDALENLRCQRIDNFVGKEQDYSTWICPFGLVELTQHHGTRNRNSVPYTTVQIVSRIEQK